MRTLFVAIIFTFSSGFLRSQSYTNIIFPNPTSFPANLTTPQYTRAAQSIGVFPGGGNAPNPVYGFVTANAQNMLNLHISSYPAYVNNSYSAFNAGNIPYNYNTSLDALCTAGVPDVSKVGSFNYNIPIVCSPGTNGMEPSLSIEYGSQNENSFLGVGFKLIGLQSIQRGGKSVFHDGTTGGVKFNNNDVFYYNGQRLLIKSGTYGAANSTYKTEVESYEKINAMGNFGSGPTSFLVENADGITLEFGNTPDSRCTDVGGTEILAWYINKIYDSNGNYMSFSYINTNGEILIDKISYTGNMSSSNMAPYQEIDFNYIDRSDNISYKINGKEFNRSKLLSEVISKNINGAVVRKYVLKYQFRLASQLKEITEVNGNGDQLNPTVFSWNSTSRVVGNYCSPIVSITSNTCSISIPVDFNGDGYKDLILFRNQTDFAFEKYTFQPTSSNCPNDFIPVSTTSILEGVSVNYLGYNVIDDDDDNIEELYVYYSIISGSSTTLKIMKIDHNPGMNITLEHIDTYNTTPLNFNLLSILNPAFNLYNTSKIYFNKSDISGDNLPDRIIVDDNSLSVDLSSNSTPIMISTNDILKTGLGDFDGDGVNDLYLLRYSSVNSTTSFYVEVLKYDPSNNSLNSLVTQNLGSIVSPNSPGWTFPSALTNLMLQIISAINTTDFGDFDGDGKFDIMNINFINSSNSEIHILKSDGISFLSDPSPLAISNYLNGFEAVYSSADINLDGLSDLIITSYDAPNKNTHLGYYASIGNQMVGPFGIQTITGQNLFTYSDFNGDGTFDVVYQNNQPAHKMVSTIFDQHPKELVTRIENIKDLIEINYSFLTGKGSYAEETPPLNNEPAFKLKRPEIFVCTRLKTNDRVQEYGYANAIYHRSGKGFLGFEKTYVSDLFAPPYTPAKRTILDFDATFDDVIGIDADYSKASFTDPFNYVEHEGIRTIQTNNFVASGSNRYLASLTVLEKNYASSTYNSVTSNFDNSNFGKILNLTKSSLIWNTASVIHSSSESALYQSYTNPFSSTPLVRPSQVTNVLTNSSGSSNFVILNTYDTQGRLMSTVNNSNLSQLAVTTDFYQYNSFGTPCSTKVSAPDLPQSRSESRTYDGTGRFLLQSVNALGMTCNFQTEPTYGNLLSSTAPGGQNEKYEYDGWGRLIKTTSSTNAVNTIKYEWYSYNSVFSPSQINYGLKTTTNLESGSWVTSYADRRGNQVKTETIGFNSNPVMQETTYDIRDRVIKSEELHFNSQQVFKNVTYSYDLVDRPICIQEKLNNNTVLRTENYSYNNLSSETGYSSGYVLIEKSTTSSAFNYCKMEHNEAGLVQVVKNYENASNPHSISYTYNQFCKPTQIQTSFPGGQGNGVTTLSYDLLGRQSSINDQSMGIQTNQYNSIGELITTTSPGSVYTMIYDVLGRLTTETGASSGSYSYDYYTSGSAIGALKKITGPIETTENVYDNFARIIESKRSFNTSSGSKQFISQCSYDKYNRLTSYKYPNNISVNYEYDASGEVKKVKKGNQILWEMKGMKTPQLLESFDISSGLTIQRTFNSNLEMQQNDVGNIYSQNYVYNSPTGNLTTRSIQNYLGGNSNNESFEYDNFDRLKKVKTTVGTNIITKQNITYNDNGNIGSKDDCGSYQYGNVNKPYTLTQVQNQQNNISLNSLSFSYNDLEKIDQLSEASTNKQFNFVYGNNFNRIQMDYKINGQTQYSRFYVDQYEREENSTGYRDWAYLATPSGITGVFYTINGVTNYYDITTDQNGSPILLTSSNGQIAEEQSFDSWGRRRNPTNWSFTNVPNSQIMIRGYGFHEHLDELGIINMNGRLYDPILGRFVQADPFIQEPQNPQNFNRYSYVLNNPVKYTDPSGYLAIGAGSGIGAESNIARQANPWAGPPTLFVDGVRIEAGSGDYASWLSGGGVGGSMIESQEYAGDLRSLGIYPGMGVGKNGQLYTVANASKINSGLLSGSVKCDPSTGSYSYGYEVILDGAAADAAHNYELVSVTRPYYHYEDDISFYGSDATYFVTDFDQSGDIDPFGVALGVGELAFQGNTYANFGHSVKEIEKLVGKGKYVHAGEVYYKGNYKGVTNSMKSSLKASTVVKNVAKTFEAAGILYSLYEYGTSPGNREDQARLMGAAAIWGTSFIPRVGPFISIGLGLYDSFGGFDKYYKSY